MNLFMAIARTIRTVHKTLRAIIGIGAVVAAVWRWATGRKKNQSFTPAAARHA